MPRHKATFRKNNSDETIEDDEKIIKGKPVKPLPKHKPKVKGKTKKTLPDVKPKAKSKKGIVKLKIIEDETLEFPNVRYDLKVKDMIKVFGQIAKQAKVNFTDYNPSQMGELKMFEEVIMSWTPEQILEKFATNNNPIKIAKILTILRPYENQSVIQSIEPLDGEVPDEHQTSQDFDEKIIKTLFWLYNEERYQYLKIKIAPSAIKAAGMGAYAVDDIPEGAVALYKGIPRTEEDSNLYYSWVVKSFDPQEGLPDDSEQYMYYIDATDFDRSNWTRYVNCGMKDKFNNMEQEQVYDKIFYTTIRPVMSGEEFFIDYGPEYREYNLGMKGKY